MEATITVFPNLRATHGSRCSTSWERIFSRLEMPRIVAAKPLLPLWLPGTLANDDRSAECAVVEQLFALCLDFDKAVPVAQAVEALSEHYGILHTSFSHCPALPCYRAVLPFDRTVTAAEYPGIWLAAAAMCRAAGLTPDPSCKNPTRIWFVPGHAPGGLFEAHRLEGAVLDPDKLVAQWGEKTAPRTLRPRTDQRGTHSDRVRRAQAYVDRMPSSIAGERGDEALWRVALAVVRGFDLDEADALEILRDFNTRCRPPWSESRLRYKLRQAHESSTLPRGYLLERGKAA
jgi:hypothetical protein